MNTFTFQDLVGGRYGRRTAYADVEAVDRSNVLDILGKTIGVFNSNRAAIKYLWTYKNGDQPVLYRKKVVRDDIVNHIVENHAWEIVRFKNSQTYGEPVQYISVSKDEKVAEAIDRLNQVAKAAGKRLKDINSGEWTSTVGTGYKAIQFVDGDIPFRITAPTPMNTFVVYSRLTEEPIMSVQEFKDEKGIQYYQCFTPSMEYKVQSGKVVYERIHAFGGIPIIEYPNNQDRISDVELVISMLDAINNMQSNRMDAIEQFVQSWVKFINCEVDEEQFQKMKMMGALVVKSNNGDKNKADVDIMTQELNQSESQVSKEDLWRNILFISAIPQMESQNSGGDTQGAVTLRAGWDHSKNAARMKDVYIEDADKRLAMLMLNRLRIADKQTESTVKSTDFECRVSHSPQDNMYVKAEVFTMLAGAGIHPKIAIETSGLWSDAEKTYSLSQPYLDGIYKTAEELREEMELGLEAKAQSGSNSTGHTSDGGDNAFKGYGMRDNVTSTNFRRSGGESSTDRAKANAKMRVK